jgi:CRP-like cAMP-binding protein
MLAHKLKHKNPGSGLDERMEDLGKILSEHPFFQGMNTGYLKRITECASLLHFHSGDFIFRQDEEANHLYVILEGKVDVELFSALGGPVVLQEIQKGGVLGWSWLMPPYRWRFDARTVEDVQTVALDAKCLRRRMEEDSGLGMDVLSRFVPVITQRLEFARLKLLNLYGAHS